MSKALEVWKLLWPKRIEAEDYERALLLAQLTRDRVSRQRTPKKLGRPPGSKNKVKPKKIKSTGAQYQQKLAALEKARAARWAKKAA